MMKLFMCTGLAFSGEKDIFITASTSKENAIHKVFDGVEGYISRRAEEIYDVGDYVVRLEKK